eukprot:TRINITY_DN4327_c0_g1_i1.p1 TRINITY_DN4327_c0_g1~~TRINITY_DN4327_c0_g1_i1.p1  ORF type:complete len:265 (-),score=26.52 TRINITY_DN4327_c0_g1_i1:107-901(-)
MSFVEDVVNYSGVVMTEDGRRLYGIDADTYEKVKTKIGPEVSQKVTEWIEGMVKHRLIDRNNLWVSLRDGIVLCQLINVIRPNVVPKYNTITKEGQEIHFLQAQENIQLYLKACQKIGLTDADMFSVPDLYSNKCMSQVINNIYSLSRKASALGIQGSGSTPSLAPVLARRNSARPAAPRPVEPKRWAPVQTHATPLHVDSLPSRRTNPSPQSSMDLSSMLIEHEKQIDVLKREVRDLKIQNRFQFFAGLAVAAFWLLKRFWFR